MIEIVKKPKLQGLIISEGSYETKQPLSIIFKPKNSFCPETVEIFLSISQKDASNEAIYSRDFILKGYPTPPIYSSGNTPELGIIKIIYDQSVGFYQLDIFPIMTAGQFYWNGRIVDITLRNSKQNIRSVLAGSRTTNFINYYRLQENYTTNDAVFGETIQDFQLASTAIRIDSMFVYEKDQANNTILVEYPLNLGTITTETNFPLTFAEPDPLPSIQFDQSTVTLTENNIATAITITRSGDTSSSSFFRVVAISGSADPGLDLSIYPYYSLVFEPGVLTYSLDLTAFSDTLTEPDETLVLRLYAENNAQIGANSDLTITISANSD